MDRHDLHVIDLIGAEVVISMRIDHIGAVVVEYGLYYQGGAECFQ